MPRRAIRGSTFSGLIFITYPRIVFGGHLDVCVRIFIANLLLLLLQIQGSIVHHIYPDVHNAHFDVHNMNMYDHIVVYVFMV